MRQSGGAQNVPALADARVPSPISELQKHMAQAAVFTRLRSVLPDHVTPEKFVRIAITAAEKNPQLISADRDSFIRSCIECASDGLMPNGKEAALVIYRVRVPGTKDQWMDAVQYMPMIRGLYKLARNSGEISTLESHVVYSKETFRLQYGFEPILEHIPSFDDDKGDPVCVYACAVLKDGERAVEAMSVSAINAIRDRCSKTYARKGGGPWKDFWEEMAKKTVMRRLLKRLPMSEEVERAIERDNAFYEVDQRRMPQLADANAQPVPIKDDRALIEAAPGKEVEVPADEARTDACANDWRVPVHPLDGGDGSDWAQWVDAVKARLVDCEHAEDVDELASANAAAVARLRDEYRQMAVDVETSIRARRAVLSGDAV